MGSNSENFFEEDHGTLYFISEIKEAGELYTADFLDHVEKHETEWPAKCQLSLLHF